MISLRELSIKVILRKFTVGRWGLKGGLFYHPNFGSCERKRISLITIKVFFFFYLNEALFGGRFMCFFFNFRGLRINPFDIFITETIFSFR